MVFAETSTTVFHYYYQMAVEAPHKLPHAKLAHAGPAVFLCSGEEVLKVIYCYFAAEASLGCRCFKSFRLALLIYIV